MKRFFFQFFFAILNNIYFAFPITKNIYQGKLKYFCSPGLNCYSCPASVFACPIGIIQNIFTKIRIGFSFFSVNPIFYITGFLGIIGITGGRIICGWACPFGLIQDLFYKIPSRKISININWLPKLKYLILILTVIVFPVIFVDTYGYGEPFFCKYLCPAGTLEAGLTLPILLPHLKKLLGTLFVFKIFFLIVFLIFFVFIKRPFCRYFCPLGAIYAIFNKISILKLEKKSNLCTDCNNCINVCPMGLNLNQIPDNEDCIRCFECVKVCNKNAIKIKFLNKE